jgi:hypothetical protein
MPVKTAQFTCSDTTRQKIVSASTQPQFVQVHNATKSSNEYVFIGNETLTLTNGFHIDPSGTVELWLTPNDDLYAMSDPDELEVHVLAVTQD